MLVVSVTLISCDNVLVDYFDDALDAVKEATKELDACDCIEAAVMVDWGDKASIASFEEEYADCEELIYANDADFSECPEVADAFKM